jgi:hypothetical protein
MMTSETALVSDGAEPYREPGRLIGTALRLELEPSLSESDRLQELLAAADFDRVLLGETWFSLTLGQLRSPSKASAEAARLVSLALDLEIALSEVARRPELLRDGGES